MHVLLSLLISWGGAEARAAEFQPRLLSYQEVMQLSSKDRIAYLREVADLLVLMEDKFERKYDVAALESNARIKGQIALLLNLAGGVPAADAEEEDQSYNRIKPSWNGTQYSCGDEKVSVFDPTVGTCVLLAPKVGMPGRATVSKEWKGACPKGSKRFEVTRVFGFNTGKCVPGDSFAAMPEGTKKFLKPGKFLPEERYSAFSKKDKQIFVGAPIPDEPESPPEASNEKGGNPNPQCIRKPQECKALTGAERKQAVLDFRRSAADKCIAGGFFTKKVRERAKNQCNIVRQYPEKAGKKDKKFSCDKSNEVLCNPTAFCLQVKDVEYEDKGPKKTDLPLSVCVNYGAHITRNCQAKFNGYLSGKPVPFVGLDPRLNKAKEKKPEACDPADLKLPSPAFQDEYTKLAKLTEDEYKTNCQAGKEGFLPLFCEECKIIGDRLFAIMSKRGKACGGSEPTPPAAAPAEAPADKAGGEPDASR